MNKSHSSHTEYSLDRFVSVAPCLMQAFHFQHSFHMFS